MEEWLEEIKGHAKLTGMLFVAIASLPFILILILFGFRHCWRCKKLKHISNTRRYWPSDFARKPERVCLQCADNFAEYGEETFI